ncbi:AraC family transcriptional regulator [Bradyrhizobium daqingense]|uniref:AraC-like DNA-binding protein n=1 Tax=Bradyrhizobium daqingense TaxID=993502 RepID=A0A562KR59_9BRAD|nr:MULTISPECIES: AraC family transcriptional regulator [Bradyrhizobium]MDQ8731678.1 AraC family transcriptional regulator [Bradyrhizobium sp. LHD-71]TWH97901.1 AraC-like DNA-binding protein [Bradyrhizobium daqingense]UFS91594.1 AraC family transcriptional regulator [Bradyrhizobium daqingense]
MSLQLSQPLTTKDHAFGSIDVSEIDGSRRRRSGYSGQAGKEGTTLSLVHLDVALAIEAPDMQRSARGSGFRVSAKRLDRNCGAEETTDPVMRRLSDALVATEEMHHPHSAILADALRLAIVTRRASAQTASPLREPDVEAHEGRACRIVRSLQKWRLKRVMQYVDENLGAKITLEQLAAVAGLSRMHFAAQFRAAVGMRPHEYLLKCRIERAQELLKQGDVSLVDTALTVGFQTQAHFTTVFKRFVGDTPYQWRSAYLAQFMPLPRPEAVPS